MSSLQRSLKQSAGPKTVRKYEGYDLGASNVTQTSRNYDQSLSKLKNKTQDQNIEEEFIEGLQDEIKFLEYQLKLLKDKEIQQRQETSQLDQFFNDGVPLNENILAMKNKYIKAKKDDEEMIESLTGQQEAQKKQNATLSEEISKQEQLIKGLIKSIEEKEEYYENSIAGVRKQYFNTKHTIAIMEDDFKTQQVLMRKLQDEIMAQNRLTERETVLSTHQGDSKKQNIQKQKDQIKVMEDFVEESFVEIDKQQSHDDKNPLVEAIQAENQMIVQKIISYQKDTNHAKNKISDCDMVLDQRKREREQDQTQIRELQQRLNQLKNKIEEQNRLSDRILNQRVKEKEAADLREIDLLIENKKKVINLYNERILNCERQTEELIEEKVVVSQKTIDEEIRQEKLKVNYQEALNTLINMKDAWEIGQIREKETRKQLDPLTLELAKINERIPIYEKENQRLRTALDYYNKQAELSKELKNFNIDEIKIAFSTQNTVNDQINEFVRKWEQIQRAVL